MGFLFRKLKNKSVPVHPATDVLRRAVPFYEPPCWYTLDPASLLVTSHFHDGLDELPPEWLANEYYADDVNKLADVARSKRGVSTLHEATGGDPTSSPRWHFNMTMGGDQELIVALRTVTGEAWGALGFFGASERTSPRSSRSNSGAPGSRCLAEGARRALLVGEATDPEGPESPGLIVLTDRWDVESLTAGVGGWWLSDLPHGDWDAGRLPAAVYAVAGREQRSGTRDRRRAPGGGDRRAGTSRPDLAASDVGIRADATRAGGHEARAPGRVDDADRPPTRGLASHRPATPQARLREDRRAQPA